MPNKSNISFVLLKNKVSNQSCAEFRPGTRKCFGISIINAMTAIVDNLLRKLLFLAAIY